MNIQEKILEKIDINYSYQLAKRMEDFRSNKILGYRPAGSKAEFETGEMLKNEMEKIGLSHVTKDAITVDGWEFHKAVLTFTDECGIPRNIQLGAYQTTFVTDGAMEFPLVYLNKGTKKDYDGIDVNGKLVLVDINQREEWWINYPVYQAHLKGAKALIAVQSGGYGEIDEEALNAQDIAGPDDAPAFSISRKDAKFLKALLKKHGEIKVLLDCDTRVRRNCTTYNITGCIPGKHKDRIILLSAHYDSYFNGFQDDNTAVSMMFGIAKALLSSGFTPNNTILLCAMAAEEWGVVDSNFDWSTGAYEQIFTVHPEWVGKVIADLNFELPALAHGTRARIRSCHEYKKYLEKFLENLPELTKAYPDETTVTAPIETWSDDFSMAIAGIPSMVNDFTGGTFMETHYHSQFDNDAFYDENVYRLHHELFALLINALDETAVVPLCFTPVLKKLEKGMQTVTFDNPLMLSDFNLSDILQRKEHFFSLLKDAEKTAKKEYQQITDINEACRSLLNTGQYEEAEKLFSSSRYLEQKVLSKFKAEQDAFVRIDWYGNVHYPHEIVWQKIHCLEESIRNLSEGNKSKALRNIYEIDNNAYAFMFDEEVYRHFTDYVFHQPKERLKWGYQRFMKHSELYPVVQELLKEQNPVQTKTGYDKEIQYLKKVLLDQYQLLSDTIADLCHVLEESFINE